MRGPKYYLVSYFLPYDDNEKNRVFLGFSFLPQNKRTQRTSFFSLLHYDNNERTGLPPGFIFLLYDDNEMSRVLLSFSPYNIGEIQVGEEEPSCNH